MRASDDIIRISAAMRELGIESIHYLPANKLVPHDSFTVHLLDGYLPSEIGLGDTVADAFADAVAKVREAA